MYRIAPLHAFQPACNTQGHRERSVGTALRIGLSEVKICGRPYSKMAAVTKKSDLGIARDADILVQREGHSSEAYTACSSTRICSSRSSKTSTSGCSNKKAPQQQSCPVKPTGPHSNSRSSIPCWFWTMDPVRFGPWAKRDKKLTLADSYLQGEAAAPDFFCTLLASKKGLVLLL